MADFKLILDRAKSGTVTKKEVGEAVAELKNVHSEADPYTLLHIIGRAGAIEYAPLVAEYLYSPEDPMLARLALQILCKFWNLTDRYVDHVGRFLEGVAWDSAGDVKFIAVAIAGDYLRSTDNGSMLRALIAIAENEASPVGLREDACGALEKALGLKPAVSGSNRNNEGSLCEPALKMTKSRLIQFGG